MSLRSALLVGSATLCLTGAGLLPNFTPPTFAQNAPEERTAINVYKVASPAVVTIRTGSSNGSGSIISADGLVLTNNHVVRSVRDGLVTVRTADGKSYQGQVIARDPDVDLALVRMRLQPGERLPVLKLGNPAELAVGQRVYAIGSPFGLSGTFTTGILSRITPEGMLQTDAAINPGNSGGPLLNSRGELIGVNTSILSSSARGGNIGIGFASSVTTAKRFIQTGMANRGTVPPATTATRPPSPGLAVPNPDRRNPPLSRNPEDDDDDNVKPQFRNQDPGLRGPSAALPELREPGLREPGRREPDTREPGNSRVRRLGVVLDPDFVIQEVTANSIAALIGLRPGDQLLAVNGRELTSDQQLSAALNSGSRMLLTVSRNRRVANLLIRL